MFPESSGKHEMPRQVVTKWCAFLRQFGVVAMELLCESHRLCSYRTYNTKLTLASAATASLLDLEP